MSVAEADRVAGGAPGSAAPVVVPMESSGGAGRLGKVAEEFNYRNRCRVFKGKFWHETFAPEQEAYARFARHKLERIAALAPGGDRLLDVGSGFGDVLYLLRDRYRELHGLDPSASMVTHAQANFREREVTTAHAFRQGLAESLAYADGHFDSVVTTDTYEHIAPEYRGAALREMFRVLRPGGTLILVTPSRARIRFWAFVDNVLTLRRQVRAGRGVSIFGTTRKDYTEVFTSRRALVRAIRGAGFEVTRVERTSFYPAPERPGFLEPVMQRWAGGRPGLWRMVVAWCGWMQRVGVFNQKLLVLARRPGRVAGGPVSQGEPGGKGGT